MCSNQVVDQSQRRAGFRRVLRNPHLEHGDDNRSRGSGQFILDDAHIVGSVNIHDGNLPAGRGWLMTLWDMPADWPPKLASLIKRGQFADADRALTTYFEDAMPRLLENLPDRFASRRPLIERAYMAHRLGLYDFTVPVFLALAMMLSIFWISFWLCSLRLMAASSGCGRL